jgi:sugar phosphate isomerase/epimerase
MDRRTFIGSIGAAAVLSRWSWAAEERRIEKIGLELYTVRDALQKDFEGTLTRVAAIGYKEVELAGYFAKMEGWDPAPKEARRILDSHGLAALSTHVPYAALSPENWPKIIEASKILGHEYIVNPSIDRSLTKTVDGWKKAAETFNRAGMESSRSGIQFGYHNHVEEFKPIDGKLPYDILLSETDPKLVKMEMDIGWAHKAGADPLRYFAKYPGRFPVVHVKDFDASGNMTDVGNGVIDWKLIFAKSDLAGIKHYFVEFDNPKDPFASIQACYAYLEKLRF